jgi:hypothetical protein
VAQAVGPEFKTQSTKKKVKQSNNKQKSLSNDGLTTNAVPLLLVQ